MKIVDSKIPPVGKPSLFRRILNLISSSYETMSGNGQCPVYLERWVIGEMFNCGLYLHHFIGDDWAIDPHDHPRRFITIGLKGWYYEDDFSENTNNPKTKKYSAPWIRSFPAEHLHRVRASECGNCWTIVIVLPKSRSWGFVQNGIWIPFKKYVFGGKSRKSC